MKDSKDKKSLPAALPFLQHLQIHRRNLLQQFLCLRERALALLDFLSQFIGYGDLAHTPIPETDGQYSDGPVAFSPALLAILATWFVAAHHSTQQGTRQYRGEVGHQANQSLAGGNSRCVLAFH
jgi:hypothetical protein